MKVQSIIVGELFRQPESKNSPDMESMGKMGATRFKVPDESYSLVSEEATTIHNPNDDQGSRFTFEIFPKEMIRIIPTEILIEEIRNRMESIK